MEVRDLEYEIIASEEEVGRAQFEEIKQAARNKDGDLVIILLGGRGAQALYRILAEQAQTDAIDPLLSRLHLFTQDALAPLRMDNGLSFVRDFERLLGPVFFEKVKSFTPMQTDIEDLEAGLDPRRGAQIPPVARPGAPIPRPRWRHPCARRYLATSERW